MFTSLTVTLCSLAALVAPPVADTGEDFEITDALLREIAATALPEVRRETGAKFPDGVRVMLSTPEEIEAALLVEARPQMALQFDDEEVVEAQAVAYAARMAPALVAKFRFEDRVVLVSAKGFHTLGEMISLPELASKEGVRGVVVHELVHAADEERFGFSKRFSSFTTTDELQAFNCIVEGHAQLVARRVAKRLGWTAGFELFTNAIGALPGDDELAKMGPALEMYLRLQVATLATAYYEGESFLAAVEKEAGMDGIARAFNSPPSETAIIFEPAWFLHPERRPKLSFDFESALVGLTEEFPEPEWTSVRVALTPPQLGIALRLLDEESVARVRGSLVQSLVQSSSLLESSGVTAVNLGLLEFRSPADAQFYLEAYRRLQRINDEQMKEGAIKITSSAYEDVEDPRGLGCLKIVDAAGTEIEVRGLCLVRGRVAVELVLTQGDRDAAAVRALALRALDGAVSLTPPEKPGEDVEEPSDGEEGD